jgi:hypothetical protein
MSRADEFANHDRKDMTTPLTRSSRAPLRFEEVIGGREKKLRARDAIFVFSTRKKKMQRPREECGAA